MKYYLGKLQKLDQSLSTQQTRQGRIEAITTYNTLMRQLYLAERQIKDLLQNVKQTDPKLEAGLQVQFLQLAANCNDIIAKLRSNDLFVADVAQFKALREPGTFGMDFDARARRVLEAFGDKL